MDIISTSATLTLQKGAGGKIMLVICLIGDI